MTLKRRIKRKIVHFIQAVLYVLFSLVGITAWLRRFGRPVQPLRKEDVRRILVIRIDLLGDVVLSMPAVEALRAAYPKAHIAMLVLPFTREVPESSPAVDEVITLDTNKLRSPRAWLQSDGYRDWTQAIRRMRDGQFDLCVSLCGLMASILAFISGAPHRVGYREESYPLLFTHPIPGRRYKQRQHEVLYCLDLARAAGADVDPASPYALPAVQPRPTARAEACALLDAHGLAPYTEEQSPRGRHYAVLHAGATNGSAKRWPARHWARLADLLSEELGLAIVLTGSTGDKPLAEAIVRHAATHPVVLTGATTVGGLAAILGGARIVLSGDSGPLHMAVALGRPTVSMYGPTDLALSGPHPVAGQPAVVLRTGIYCSPCYNHDETAECRFGNPVCMIDIAPADVLAATRRVLADIQS